MFVAEPGLLGWALNISMMVISIAFILAFVRLVIGPTLPDRVIALDLIAYLVISFFALYSVAVDQSTYIEAALALALIAFLGTIAFARYIERTSRRSRMNEHVN